MEQINLVVARGEDRGEGEKFNAGGRFLQA
jgi:hypothetical protein